MKNRWLNAFTISVLLTLVSLYIYSLDLAFIQHFELKAYDLKMSLRGVRPVSDQVVIVAVDEPSLKREGRWPWPRTRLAKLVDKITESGATVIGLDLLFPEKDSYVPFREVIREIEKKNFNGMNREKLLSWLKKTGDSDAKLVDAIRRSQRLVLGYFVYATAEQSEGSVERMGPKELDLLDSSQYSIVQISDKSLNPELLHPIVAVGLSLPSLMDAAKSAGYFSFLPESDGILRFVPMVQVYNKALYPPFSLQILKEATGLNTAVRVSSDHIEDVLLGDTAIPVTEQGDFLINYYGPTGTFAHLSASDVLGGTMHPDQLKNKIVLVGATAIALPDLHSTPYDPLIPGVEVHATIIENILNRDFLQRPPWVPLLSMTVILGGGLLLGLASLYFRALGTAAFLLLEVGGYLGADFISFVQKGLWVDTVYPNFSLVLVYFGVTLYRFMYEEHEKRFIKKAFSQYLAPTVVERLVENPKLLKLGGERKVLTAFFSDVAGFSSIAETMEAEELVDLLNDYLTEMTEIILKYEGTVDKYEGDAIIAFFGAPVYFEDHATRTCLVALDMQNRLAELREVWKKENRPEMFMRIGINTGPMVVGNMGSINRMDYTMMGDSVNLAARLEGVNKQYKTFTILSEFTYELAKNDIEARELDLIRVIGKKEPIKIYEVLGRKGELDDLMRVTLPHFKEGLKYYKNWQWDKAINSFERALSIHEGDGPSLVYFERCIAFKKNPPRPDWDGVFAMKTK